MTDQFCELRSSENWGPGKGVEGLDLKTYRFGLTRFKIESASLGSKGLDLKSASASSPTYSLSLSCLNNENGLGIRNLDKEKGLEIRNLNKEKGLEIRNLQGHYARMTRTNREV